MSNLRHSYGASAGRVESDSVQNACCLGVFARAKEPPVGLMCRRDVGATHAPYGAGLVVPLLDGGTMRAVAGHRGWTKSFVTAFFLEESETQEGSLASPAFAGQLRMTSRCFV